MIDIRVQLTYHFCIFINLPKTQTTGDTKMTIHLAADTINGVYEISKAEVDGELLSGEDFLASLKGCADDEVLFTAIDDAALIEKIDAEYGINRSNHQAASK